MSLLSGDGQQDDWRVQRSIISAQDGSYAAIGQLFDLYRDYLLRVANEELETDLVPKVAASDLVQETFLQAARDFRKFIGTSEGELKAWLRQILIHNLLDAQRRYHHAQKRAVALEVPLAGACSSAIARPELASSSPSPSECVVTSEQRELVHAALRRLPPDHAQVIQLRTFAGLPFDLIGDAMGRSGDAVRKLWVRAIERLAIDLAPYEHDGR
ncbi:MAG TPA: sigma-70 family RNA polymerase sigma factor [Pirellulales bacterium]|jgi:RNA polymerase sigma-70 factor (ECF subfamily)